MELLIYEKLCQYKKNIYILFILINFFFWGGGGGGSVRVAKTTIPLQRIGLTYMLYWHY